MRGIWLKLPVLMLLLLAACAPVTPVSVVFPSDGGIPTGTATAPAAAPTATIVWFPATATHTPAPALTAAPTPEMRPGVEGVTLTDPLDGSGTRWPVSRTSVGSVAYGNSELTLAVSQPKGSLTSLSAEPVLGDFYLEITTQANLCRGQDQYGLLLRATSDQDFYRLLINCDGYLRVERANGGKLALVQDWMPSGQVPPGSPLELRLGVWAVGSELRVFLNDVFQFSVKDPVFKSGRIGLFARSAGDTPLTVSFTNLVVRSVDAGSDAPFSLETPLPPDSGDLPTQAAAAPAPLATTAPLPGRPLKP